MAIKRASTVNCLYGPTGTTKTSRLGDAAEYYYEKSGGKPCRYVCTDSGGWDPLESLVDDEIIIPYKFSMDRGSTIIADLTKLAAGWWPEDIRDPLSPLRPPAVNGLMNDEVSALLWDGLSSTSDILLLVHELEAKVVQDEENPTKKKVESDTASTSGMPKNIFVMSGEDFVRRALGKSDYGSVQRRVNEIIARLSMLPVPAEVTCLETKGEDDDGKPIYGPMFVGKALTNACGAKFGHLIHMDMLEVEVDKKDPQTGKVQRVRELRPFMFTRTHVDPKDPLRIKHPAKIRVARTKWDRIADFYQPNLKKLYELLDELRAEESRERQESFAAASASNL